MLGCTSGSNIAFEELSLGHRQTCSAYTHFKESSRILKVCRPSSALEVRNVNSVVRLFTQYQALNDRIDGLNIQSCVDGFKLVET